MCACENSAIMVHNSFFNNNKAVGDEAGILDAGNGGGMHLSQCHLAFFSGMNDLNENQAGNGGAIYASQSNLFVEAQSLTEMNSNLATHNGGALHLTMSTLLEVRKNIIYVIENRAIETGGGLHVANSTLIIDGMPQFSVLITKQTMEEDLAWREALKSMEYHLKMTALILYLIKPVMMELYMCMMRQTLTCVQLIPYGMQHGQLNAF